MVTRLLARFDALIEHIPTPLRTVLGPVLAPLGAAARTLLLTVSGNVAALADEPVVVIVAAVQAWYAIDGASVRDRLAAAALVFGRALVHTGVGPNAADSVPDRVGETG